MIHSSKEIFQSDQVIFHLWEAASPHSHARSLLPDAMLDFKEALPLLFW
jgi:hypothetical protein